MIFHFWIIKYLMILLKIIIKKLMIILFNYGYVNGNNLNGMNNLDVFIKIIN